MANPDTKIPATEELAYLRDRVAQLEAEVRANRRAEATIAESEERFRSVVEHSHDGIIIIDDGFKIVYANGRLCRLTGYSNEELVGGAPTVFMTAKSAALASDRYRRRIKGENVPSRYDLELQGRDGQRRQVEISAAIFSDKAGRRFDVAQFLDLTEQRRAQAALRESEERYRLLTDHSLTGIYISQHGKFLYVNPRLAQIVGFEADEITGGDIWRHVHPDDRELVKKMSSARQRGEPGLPARYEHRIVRRDGRTGWVEILAKTITLDGAPANIGNVVDITDRKRAEQALLESEYRFRCLQDASFGGIAIHDDGIILDANEALSDLTGFTLKELIGMDGLGLIAPGWREAVRAKIRSGYGLAYEVEGIRKDGSVYPLEIRGKTMPYKERQARVTEFRDISELKRAQKALEKSEERFSVALKASPQWIAISTKAEGRTIEVNEAFSATSGFSREEALGRTSVELGFWQDPGERARIIRLMEEQGCIRNAEVQWRLKDGLIHNMLWSADPIDWDGEECLINALTDVTELTQAHQSLRASEERYRSVMEAAYEPMVVYDLEGRADYINPAFTRVFGWSADEILGRRIDFVPEEEKPRALREIRAVLRDGYCENYETQRLTKDGRKLDISISAANYRDHDGNVKGMVAHLRDIGQRKSDERELRESEARFKHMVELAGDWFWEMDADLRYSGITTKYSTLAGIPPDEFIGKTRWEFVGPHTLLCDPDKWKAHIEDVKAHRPFHRFEYGVLTESNKPFYMSISGVPLFDDKGEFCGYRGSGTDITDRVLAQDALQKAHDQLEAKVAERTAELEQSRRNFMQAFHESPAWMSISDAETGRFIEVNQAYCSGLGRTRHELIGKISMEAGIWPNPEARERWARAVRSGAESDSQGAMEVDLLHKDGSVRTVTASVGIMHWGGKQVFVSTAFDISEQKKAQAALLESEQKYRTILDNTGTATAILDEDTFITFVNPEFERLLGYSSDELVGKIKWTDFVHEDDVEKMLGYARMRREKSEAAPNNYEFRLVTRSGAIKNVFLTTDMIPGTNSNVSSLMDITDLKLAQEELREHRDRLEDVVGERTRELRTALNEKEVLLREIHHRVKNNMAVVSSLLSLQANKVDDLIVRMALRESQNRVQAMALIHEALYQSHSLAEVDLQQYIDNLLANLISIFGGKSGRVSFQVDTGGVKLGVNKAVPCGLIINELITNTLKYAFPQGGGGRVNITARLLEGGEAELVVSDNGAGFPPDLDLESPRSLGLRLIGLMVEQLHGKWAVSNAGGATVTIHCPLENG